MKNLIESLSVKIILLFTYIVGMISAVIIILRGEKILGYILFSIIVFAFFIVFYLTVIQLILIIKQKLENYDQRII